MKTLLISSFRLLAGTALLLSSVSARAAESSAPTNTAAISYESVMRQADALLGSIEGRVTTLTTSLNTISNTVTGFKKRLTDVNTDIGTLNTTLGTLQSKTKTLRDCVEKGQANCLPEVGKKADLVGRNPTGGVAGGTRVSASGNTETWRTDIDRSDYPFCSIVGAQELSWKQNRLYKGDSYWQVDLERATNSFGDHTDAFVRVECFKFK